MSQSSTHRPWVNFKELRASLRFEDVLRFYGVEVRRNGEQHTGPCPLPNHTKSRNAPTFSAQLERGIFRCFSCGAHGNLLEFAGLMERIDPADGQALRTVAVKLQRQFLPEGMSRRAAPEVPVAVNAPMDFTLKGLVPTHPFFAEHGITEETARHFGAGFCSRGVCAGRIAAPIHDADGSLVGYAGLALTSEDEPPMTLPTRRERGGKTLAFDASALLYNAHRVGEQADMLTVLDNIEATWALHQAGVREVVAILGGHASSRQILVAAGILAPSGTLHLITGNDALGREFVPLAAQQFLTRWLRLPSGSRIDPAEIKRRLG